MLILAVTISKVSMIGYRESIIKGVMVRADLTTRIDIKLQSKAR